MIAELTTPMTTQTPSTLQMSVACNPSCGPAQSPNPGSKEWQTLGTCTVNEQIWPPETPITF